MDFSHGFQYIPCYICFININQTKEVAMKATKFISVLAILALATDDWSDTTPKESPPDTLQKACKYLWLVINIYQHIDPRTFMQEELQEFYTVIVQNDDAKYMVYGRYNEWEDFFMRDFRMVPMNYNYTLN